MGLRCSACRKPGVEVLEDRLLFAAGAAGYAALALPPPELQNALAAIRAETRREEEYRPGVPEVVHDRGEQRRILTAMLLPPQHVSRDNPHWLLSSPRTVAGVALASTREQPAGPGSAAGREPIVGRIRLMSSEGEPEAAALSGPGGEPAPLAGQARGVAAEDAALESDIETEEEPEPVGLEPEPGGPLAGLLPLGLKSLQQSADAFFEHLARLAGPWEGDSSLLLPGPWVVVVAAAAGELVLLPGLFRKSRPAPPGIEGRHEEEEA
jgi:hypothetical protein